MSDAALPSSARTAVLTYIAANRVTAIGTALGVLPIVAALFAPWIATHDPLDQSFLAANQGPTAEHWFGTDAYGRDVFSRVLLGGRVSLTIGVCAPLLSAFFGIWTGMIAAALGPSFQSAVVAIAVALFPRFVRLSRSATQVVRREPFIDASIAAGRGPTVIMLRHPCQISADR